MLQIKSPLDYFDIGFMLAGAVILAVALLHWQRRGRPDPLKGSPIRANGLNPLLVWLCLAVYIVGGAAGSALGAWLVPATLAEEPAAAWQDVVAAVVTQLMAVAACVVVARLTFTSGLRGFGLGRCTSGSILVWSVGGWLAALAVCGSIIWFTQEVIQRVYPDFEEPEHSVFVTLSAEGVTTAMRVLALAAAAVFAPLGEELLFRGILQSAVKKLGAKRWGSLRHRWFAISVSATAFGFMHLGTPQYIPALIALGVILGYLYERRGSLIVPIVVHILFNTKSLLWYHLQLWYGFSTGG